MAVSLAFYRSEIIGDESLPSAPRSLLVVLLAMLSAVSLTSLILWAVWRRRGFCFPRQSGEFFLCAISLMSVANVATQILTFYFWEGREGHFTELCTAAQMTVVSPGTEILTYYSRAGSEGLVTAMAATALIDLALCWIAAVLMPALRWRLFTFAFGVNYVADLICFLRLMYFDPNLSGGSWSIINATMAFSLPVFLLVMIVKDFRQPQRLPWTHWAGAAMAFLLFGLLHTVLLL
ncbi:hypothetical protein [Lignipirellula cremea]|nr:hypothetical protein [Lignipirellula cremea]